MQLKTSVTLLGEDMDLSFQLDGYTVLDSNSLSFFRDGDVVLIKSKPKHTQQPALLEGARKRKRAAVASRMALCIVSEHVEHYVIM